MNQVRVRVRVRVIRVNSDHLLFELRRYGAERVARKRVHEHCCANGAEGLTPLEDANRVSASAQRVAQGQSCWPCADHTDVSSRCQQACSHARADECHAGTSAVGVSRLAARTPIDECHADKPAAAGAGG